MAVVAFYLVVGGIPAALLGVVAAYVNARVFRRLEPPRRRYTLAGVVVLVTVGVAELLRVVVTGALAMTLMERAVSGYRRHDVGDCLIAVPTRSPPAGPHADCDGLRCVGQ